MPRFLGLAEAIQYQITESLAAQARPPLGSPLAAQLGTNDINPAPTGDEELNVLRWGFSTWGIEPVTMYYKPGVILSS